MQVISLVAISKLKSHPNNPRLIRDEQFKTLCESIKTNPDYFQVRPILCNKEMVVFAGNMRLRAAQEIGLKEVPCAIMDVTPERERELMIRDNVQNGEYDVQLLSSHFGTDELKNWGMDMSKFGVFDEKEEDKEPASLTGSASKNLKPTIKVTFDDVSECERAVPLLEAFIKQNNLTASFSVSAGEL